MTAPRRVLEPVPLAQVRLTDTFWAPRQRQVREVMLPYQWQALNDAIPDVPKSYAIHNLRLAAGQTTGTYGGPVYQDSDLAKWLEAVGYTLATGPSPALEQAADSAVALLAAAQQPDGYLNSAFIAKDQDKRFTNLQDWHELYCAGHLLEGALAYTGATGKPLALATLRQYMDLLVRTFGPGPGQLPGYCGHPELELALVKLYRATGERRYLELAKFFVDQRGQPPVYFRVEAERRGDHARRAWGDLDVYQAHVPLRQQRTAEGHAVRAVYLYSGAADVAMETGDAELWATCRQLWENIAQRRLSVHGGIGASRFHERFTIDYDLPNEEVYAETCAAIGLVFFSYRMLCGEPAARYADVMERALYNGIVSGVSLDGTKFFYDNYLASYPGIHAMNHQKPPERVGWFGTACCPPNLARLTASLGSYLYGTSADTLYVHHYVGSQWSCTVGGQTVLADMVTSYPWDGDIALTVRPPAAATFAVALRLPGWCRAPELSVNGRRQALEPLVQSGYAVLRRTWQPGDRIELRLPMPIERLYAHPKVRQDAGRVALQRGPLLYCLEQVDNGPDLNALVLPRQARLEAAFRPGLLGGVTVITGEARRDQTADWGETLYRPQPPVSAPVPFTAVPYYAWANRGPGELLVWLRDAP